MKRDVVDFYHSLINDQTAALAREQMNEGLRRRKCYFGDRPLCTVLRPNFYTPEQWAYLKYETEIVLGAFRKAHAACFHNPIMRAQLDLEAYEEALFSLDIGFDVPWTTSRLDSFFTLDDMKLKFVEYNAETPAGIAYDDAVSDVFLELDLFKTFNEAYHTRTFPVRQGLFQSLAEVYRQWGGVGIPNIAIVDWADVPTLNEHELCKIHFESEGARVVLADPRELEYRGGRLYAGDFAIDLIYKRVLCSELIERMGLENPIVHALRDHNVVMSNAFSAKLMAKKASFAFLSDERNHFLFNADEVQAIGEHIPWTRRVEERVTQFHDQRIDLVEYVADHRDQFVLKPNDEYGGKGVVMGWEVTDEVWAETLRTALTTPFVVQEKVRVAYEDYPSLIDDQIDISPRLVDADPFVFFGRTTSGCMTRLSSSSLLNVTAGGGSIVPSFIIYKRDA
ncbi:MAG: circularly permuted type 2 ATP-grasp protein [Pleurocapsa minor GSE-CHR-MK-17-07R]|jgi:hypothetical protein|nr:circularly permuted type 2 ATP-grasp protein [Pleurocapsa minor GSE-CHR-MK 17-07R]